VVNNSAGTFAPTAVAPGVNNQNKEEDKAEAQQDHRPGLVFPKLPKASGDFIEIHADANLH
jgi:hypothetical protein